MAAEIPVEDVLCEAMEYLSKLGSNLRTRSDNLKEKKIRKDKLTNSLAVQKAADKVLLICELSKKSLANVEAGVRKILEHIDVSQASSSIGGKSSKSKTDNKDRKRDDKPKYYYFDYKSRKLKIKNKISLKHYKSVKVLAKRMSMSVIDKYPVYHDCKLYRRRVNKTRSVKKPKDGNDESCVFKASSTEQRENLSDTSDDIEIRRSSGDKRRRESKADKKSPLKKKINVIEDSDSQEDNSNENKNSDSHEKVMDVNNPVNKASNVSVNEIKTSEEPEKKKRKIDENDRNQHNDNNDDVQMLDSDSENLNPSSHKDDNGDNERDTSENESKKPIIKCVSLSKLLKPDVLQKDSTKPASKNVKSVASKKTFDVSKKNEMLAKAKKNKEDNASKKTFDVSKKNEMLATAKKNKEDYLAKKRKEVSEFKPKKFVINIIRLPDFDTDFLIENKLQKIIKAGETVCEITKDKLDSNIEQAKQEKNNTKGPKANSVASALSDDSDDEQLIAEANKVKNSLLNESDSENDIDNTKNNEKDTETTVDRIKNALLNSDSDQNDDASEDISNKKQESEKDNGGESISDTQLKEINKKDGDQKKNTEGETAKDDTLDSDNKSEKSDQSCNKQDKENSEIPNNPETLEDQKTPEMEQASSNEIQKTPEKELASSNDNNAKDSLLNDSSDDVTETPLSQRKEATPQSQKKRIRESVQAKNALLRYSSGSETEDEQLRNTLNDIKKSLLEGMSDDENKLKAKKQDEEQRSSEKSSSSDENIIKRVKKKKSHTKRKKRCLKSDSEGGTDHSSDDDSKPTSSSRKMVRSKAKPGNSSSHSSDAQDLIDKDIDGLTNLRTLNKTRRRNSDEDESESSKTTVTRSRMGGKPTGLISEEILNAESSSDAQSNDEDDAVDEELPPVTVTGFNGGLQHLVKEDLLGESDSSVSNKEDNNEESDEERLNARRRKAHAIASSDSETATASKNAKDDDVRLTDFDDSDDSEVTKRAKRKKKGSDSDASGDSSETGKKKRRRIKPVNDSDASGSDAESEGKNKHGRKNIRKVMGKNQLEEATKKAAREEKERVARIAERQKMYNNLQFDESGKPDEVVLDKVILDFDPDTKEPLIAVDRGLVKKLKPHQANGIKFMWDACFESAKRLKKDKGSGCILAHCMGLGKTLQVVALTHTLLAHDTLTKVHRVLVVCPLSTVLNWVNEFKIWLKYAERDSDLDVYELSRFKQNSERAFQLSQWFEHGGVCVLGYEMFRNLSADNNKKFKKKMLKNFQEALVDPGPDLVVCDEGHLLKNEKTSLSQSMNKVKTLRRIVLTGTPLQNNLKEYYCMVQFVKPNLLGKYNEYLNRFVNPITNGQYTDSTEHDIKIMKRRSHVLHKMLDGAVQRRDYGVLAPFLPPKHEYVLFITLTEVQTKLYQFYLDNYSRRPRPGKSSGFLFPDFQSLQRIWTHPLVLKYNSERYEVLQQKKRDKEEEDSEGSLVDFIDDDSTPDESSSADSSDDLSDLSDDSRKKSKKKKSSKKSKGKDKDKESAAASRRRGTRANPELELEENKDNDDLMEVKYENPTEWWIKMVDENVLEDMRNSHKLILLFDILRQCETIGDKLLVFSQSLYSLDLIEHFLGKVDEATQEGRIDEKLGNHVGSWSPGIDYFRLDGSTSCENRSIWCKNFNREDNPRARLFLISTRAGGLGINLVAANRVVIFDVSWNPSHDVQSIFRVYRFGQKKPCYVYRFLAMGTMEEKIYERQVTKQAISKRVIDEQQIDRHYAENDLAELYMFEAEPPSPRPIPPLPKDRLFAEMLREHEAQIYKYHEHDSLLENKEEETLSEEERKAAWEDFENEKNRPPPAPFPSPWPMHNGMVPNLLAQQQQQLAYAALAAMLRKDMPNVNDNQIRDMLPMIYNANPAMFGGYDYGLMQKMTEIYKYSQQMNMTPGMMGQGGMNTASTGGGMAGMSGASGLQYEPPWQRQQQQQQQMRLQQLMAQQQSMGAASKYYAGGLGSRDPVAMALQQQRAREIMVTGGAGRPRGRPPLQPRAPPAPNADVVNLDSD